MAVNGQRRAAQARLNWINQAGDGQITDEQQHVNFSGVAEDIDNQVLLEMNGQHPAGDSRVRPGE